MPKTPVTSLPDNSLIRYRVPHTTIPQCPGICAHPGERSHSTGTRCRQSTRCPATRMIRAGNTAGRRIRGRVCWEPAAGWDHARKWECAGRNLISVYHCRATRVTAKPSLKPVNHRPRRSESFADADE